MKNVYKSLFDNETANELRTGKQKPMQCEEEIEYLIQVEEDFSLREMSLELQKEGHTVSPATISRIAHKLDYRPYTMICRQELTNEH